MEIRLGDAKTMAALCALEIATFNRFLEKRNSQPRGLSLASETDIDKNLYTRNIPNPEILIRTGNTHRLSNFLLWQAAYTEIFFEKKLWPDLKNNDLNRIINKFSNIKRNFGNI